MGQGNWGCDTLQMRKLTQLWHGDFQKTVQCRILWAAPYKGPLFEKMCHFGAGQSAAKRGRRARVERPNLRHHSDRNTGGVVLRRPIARLLYIAHPCCPSPCFATEPPIKPGTVPKKTKATASKAPRTSKPPRPASRLTRGDFYATPAYSLPVKTVRPRGDNKQQVAPCVGGCSEISVFQYHDSVLPTPNPLENTTL